MWLPGNKLDSFCTSFCTVKHNPWVYMTLVTIDMHKFFYQPQSEEVTLKSILGCVFCGKNKTDSESFLLKGGWVVWAMPHGC